jgi:para-aminobenzoate synthetase / 4-amino-4-deoxychorismate lyase
LTEEGGQKAVMLVILDGDPKRLAFHRPRALIRADRLSEVPAALQALEAARAGGKWLAGAFFYELGYALEARLQPLLPETAPLLLFGVFDGPVEVPPFTGRAYAGPLQPEWDEKAYGQRFLAVKEKLAAGDIYQANLSFRAGFAFAGCPRALYEHLRAAAQAPHCAYLDFFDEKIGGNRQILSLSPELFFQIEGDDIISRPMKGTSARDGDDAAARAALAASPKDRAENLMIVDLIRNDLGRIAQTGSVTVRDLFKVETYPQLHTMVSTVAARLRPGTDIAAIVRALFPCGSVTGAPKIRAMEILRDLESSPRGAYCGAVGFFAPDGDARFNVAIRTLTIEGEKGRLGIGGGVVQDSREASEYAECLLKARFFEAPRRPLELIETLKFEGGKFDSGFVRLGRHLARMKASARRFGFAFDAARAREALDEAMRGHQSPLRLRLTLDESGLHKATAAPLPANPSHWTYVLSPERTDSSDELLRHKTNWRDLYEAEAARLKTDEAVFQNERGELTEGARSNVFVKRDGILLTPPLSSGLLPGILRAELLESGKAREAVLTEADLAGEVYFGNSLRGLIPAVPA